MKKYGIAIPLSGEVLHLAKKYQKKIYDSMCIKSTWVHGADPHINLISGKTENIENIVSKINNFKLKKNRTCELLGLGILITPDPLIYMRFTNSNFLKELRLLLFNQTLPLWNDLTNTVKNEIWIPKCTLAYNDFNLSDLSKAVVSLNDTILKLKMEINELSIIDFTKKEYEVERIKI